MYSVYNGAFFSFLFLNMVNTQDALNTNAQSLSDKMFGSELATPQVI